jgi:hypothetical protein
MKLEKLIANKNAITEIVNLDLVDVQKAWDLSLSLDSVNDHLKKFAAKRDEIIKKFGESVEGEPEKFKVENIEGFNEAVNKLLAVDVLVKFPKLSISDLAGATLSATTISALRDLDILTK